MPPSGPRSAPREPPVGPGLPRHGLDRDRRGLRASGSPTRAPRCSSRRGPRSTAATSPTRIAAGGGRVAYRAAELTDEAAGRGRRRRLRRRRSGGSTGCSRSPAAAAGGSATARSTSSTRDAWDATLALNLRTQALVCRAVVRQMRAQEPDESGHPRLDPADGQRHRHRSGPGAVRDARLRGGQGRDRGADDDDGGDLRRRPDPGQRGRAVADRDADGDAGRGRRADPRLRAAQAAAGRRDARPGRGRPRRRLLPVRRVAGRDRPGAEDRRRLVGRVGRRRTTRDELRPDRPRRHRPGRRSASPTPTSTSSSTAAGRSSCARTSCSPTSTGWRPRCATRRRPGSGRDRRDAGRRGPEPRQARRAVAADRRPHRRADRPPPRAVLRAVALEHAGVEDELADLFVADVTDGHRRARLRRPDRPADRRSGPASSRSPAARAVRRRATADLPGRRGGPPPDRRPDPHPLRGRHRRARAGPASSPTPASRRARSR